MSGQVIASVAWGNCESGVKVWPCRGWLGRSLARRNSCGPDQEGDSPPQIVFFARVGDLALLELLEFYSEDIRALEGLGFAVFRTNSFWKAMTSPGVGLVSWWWHSSLPVTIVWRIFRGPVVTTGATHAQVRLRAGTPRDRAVMALTTLGTRVANVNMAISETELRDLERLGAPRVRVVYPAVDSAYFRPGPKSTVPTAVTIGQLNLDSIKRKGVDTAVRAAALLHHEGCQIRLLVAGPATSEGWAYLLDIVRSSDASNVTFLGQVSREEKRNLLAQAWFYFQPSRYEGFGLAVLEAMACGAVPVCSSAGSLPEVVGAAGVLIDGRTEADVAAAASSLIANSPQRLFLARRARERAMVFDRGRHSREIGTVLRDAGVVLPR